MVLKKRLLSVRVVFLALQVSQTAMKSLVKFVTKLEDIEE